MERLVQLLFLAGIVFISSTGHPVSEEADSNCGYQSCHPLKDGYINVHIVPHTHDDVGWLKTVDQYYYGSKPYIQKAAVEDILDSVIAELKKNVDRRFIYVETAFFWKWWMRQHDFVKHQVRNFVRNGQLEFISGAWSMNDEATTHYQSIIDQFTWGLRKLNETFGSCGRPKVGWQIDPFGHSREMASIFAQLGFDGLLLGRIDYQDKLTRFTSKSAEMVWEGSDNLGNKSDLFTSVMYNTYSPPPGFCFDLLCNDEPIVDDRKSPMYNVPDRINAFFEYTKNVSERYATDNIIITMGEDFNYQDAYTWFKNLDKLIHYANEEQNNGSKFNLIYSTPSCYLKAVHDEGIKKQMKWPVKTDDFFPYASDSHAFWTGYFTSRPTIKRFERVGNNFLQVCKQLYALADLDPLDWADLNVLREAMGVMQHHDAITGTEKEHVAHDYARILSKGFEECEFTSAMALSKLVPVNKEKTKTGEDPAPAIPFSNCQSLNTSSCPLYEQQSQFIVTIYNPLSRTVSKYARIPVAGKAYSVTDPDGKKIAVQIMPIPETVLNIPGRESNATAELIFLASELPPLGFKSYYIQLEKGDAVVKAAHFQEHYENGVRIKVDGGSGLITEITMNGKTIPIKQEFLYYRGTVGDNRVVANRSSGAYIFRPNGTDAYKLTNQAAIKLFKGDLVTELRQVFSEWVSQIIRVYANESFVEFDWLVGPIPVDDVNGKEIISRFTTELDSASTFYTDSNGRELLKRVRNFRPTWKLDLEEPVSGNYYPVTSKILIRDEKQDVEVAVLTDRAQGGSSIRDGEIELMVHRSCLHDDSFGVDEALNEQAFDKGLVVRGRHYLVIGPFKNSTEGKTLAAQERDLAQRKLLSAWTFVSPTNNYTYEEYKSKFKLQYSGLQRDLPDNVQILTLEPWQAMYFLLRLEHVLEKDEDPRLSQPAIVDLRGLFTPFEIISIRETTLGANQWLPDNQRLNFEKGTKLEDMVGDENEDDSAFYYAAEDKHYFGLNDNFSGDVSNTWQSRQANVNDVFEVLPQGDNPYKIQLNPMQIRTFVIDVKKK